jgi:hypothetical protein
MAENFGTAMRGMFLPQYDYLARKQAAMQVAQAELQSLLGRYENQVEAQARKSRSSAVDQLARYGQLTSTTAARAFGEIEAGKAADLNAAYGNIEQERASARARMAEVQQMKGMAKAQDIGNLVKTGIGVGLGIAGMGVAGKGAARLGEAGKLGAQADKLGSMGLGDKAAGLREQAAGLTAAGSRGVKWGGIMSTLGQGLTGLPFAAGQGAYGAYREQQPGEMEDLYGQGWRSLLGRMY